MTVFDIVILVTIVFVFTTFGVVLAGVTWYCSDHRKQTVDHRGHRVYRYPSGTDVTVDDYTATEA
jgi:hypothetical protein